MAISGVQLEPREYPSNYWQVAPAQLQRCFAATEAGTKLPAVLHSIIFAYLEQEATKKEIDTKSLRNNTLYGLFIQENYILLEYQTNRTKKTSETAILFFQSKAASTPSFSISEKEPETVMVNQKFLHFMHYKTQFSAKDESPLNVEHLILDHRRRYFIEGDFDPKDVEFWEMNGPNPTDKKLLVNSAGPQEPLSYPPASSRKIKDS